MLSIKFEQVEESIAIGDLFNQLEIANQQQESLHESQFLIEVKSLDGWYGIEGFRWTKPEPLVRLALEGATTLVCSPKHLVATQDPKTPKRGIWTEVGALSVGDKVSIEGNKLASVVSVEELNALEQLCDLQVEIAHSYLANGVLSHNSHFLTQIGCHALKLQKNVLHYTFELSESKIGIRYDSNLTSIDSNEVVSRKQEILEYYEAADADLGRLRIKYYSPNTATVQTLRTHIERLALKGFTPDLILIDYADIMRSSRHFEDLRRELKLIYEELRGFAAEINVPIWTASQSNKEGSRTEVVDMDNMSESYGKAMVADFIVGLSRKPEEKATGRGRLYVAKNRNGKDGLMFPVIIDTARSQIQVIGEGASPSARGTTGDKSTDLRESLREKLRELQAKKEGVTYLSSKKVG